MNNFDRNPILIKRIISYSERISEWTGKIFCWPVVILNILVVIEVILRRVFNHPTLCGFEVTNQIYGFHFMITAAYGLLHNCHVNIDIFHNKFPPRVKALIDVISYLIFFFPFVSIVIYEGTKMALRSWAQLENSWSVCASPIYPIKTVIPIAFILLLIQGLSIFLGRFYFLVKGKKI
jgi:TRAP-type mannitol/chloroaromatic compound transport system permease small subunit